MCLDLGDGFIVVLLVDIHTNDIASESRILKRQFPTDTVTTAGNEDDLVLDRNRLLALNRQVDTLKEAVRELGEHHKNIDDQLEHLCHGNAIISVTKKGISQTSSWSVLILIYSFVRFVLTLLIIALKMNLFSWTSSIYVDPSFIRC